MNQLTLLLFVMAFMTGCTSPRDPAPAPCCATNLPASAANPLPDQSLYQLTTTWTNDSGRALRLEALHGRVQVVALFFSRCTSACPLLVHDMQRLEAAVPEPLRDRIGWTLVTLDTEHDTPAVLHAYRVGRKLAAQWTLLRGRPDDTRELAALLGVKFKREATGQFAHSNLITVLNEQGEIIHQLVGLNQDIGETVRLLVSCARHEPSTPQ